MSTQSTKETSESLQRKLEEGAEQETIGAKTKAEQQQAEAEKLLPHEDSANKAQVVKGYYSNDDVTILLDGLLKRSGFERIRGGDEQDIVRNLQTGANCWATIILTGFGDN